MMGENAAAENDGIRSRETVFANLDRLRGLAANGEIDAVGEQLRTKAADRREGADPHARRAINQMPAANAGMPFYDQLRAPPRLVRKMPARAAGETGDPVQLPDNRVRAEMEQIDTFAKGEVTDPRAFFHHEFSRENPGETDVARRMDGITELLFDEGATQPPRQQQRK